MSEQDTTITKDGLARLLHQFKDAADLRGLLTSYLDQVQALEDAAFPILTERNINAATGDRLDGLGKIVKLSRGALSDDAYRIQLKAEFAVLWSRGTEAELVAIVALLVQMDTDDFEYQEYYPKSLTIRPVDHVLTVDPAAVGTALSRAASACTETGFIYAYYADASVFTLSGQGAVVETSSFRGLADTVQATGGRLSGVK